MARAEAATAQGSAADGIATRERIVRAASAMFLARGFDAVPMSQVADAAGVTTPALYWHFKSKTDLFFEVLKASYRSFFDELVSRTAGKSARQRLHSYVRGFVELQLADGDVELADSGTAMMFGVGQLGASLPDDKQEEFEALQRRYGEYLKGILQYGNDAGEFAVEEVSVTAQAIHSMCEYTVVWYKPNQRLTAVEVADLYADLALRMATGPAPETT